jgi:hypothetical protein
MAQRAPHLRIDTAAASALLLYIRARIALASEHLPYAKRLELWLIVDGREACIKLSGSSFSSEMEQVDRELEAALRCS